MAFQKAFRTADTLTRHRRATGIPELDDLLGGGLECGMVHLFYGDSCVHDDMLRFAVQANVGKNHEAHPGSVIIIDSVNMIDTNRMGDIASSTGIDPEDVFDRVHVSRAFNSSQTYDLVVNHLEGFVQSEGAQLLLLPGLIDIFLNESLDAERVRQITHMAASIMQLALNHGVACVISAMGCLSPGVPRAGQSMLSSSQIHVFVERTPMRVIYSLTKHAYLPERSTERMKQRLGYLITVPLEEFL
ncbi:hypothetical protein EU545_03570 [Candidatus Thorarchaeota archaeon]|nr:MAG: hypothetical protein EU545_03570 [Candidatus Thorarchaeota archaeon]